METAIFWRLMSDDDQTFTTPERVRISYGGISSLIPFFNTADIREDMMDLKNGTAYRFFCRNGDLPVMSVLIARCEMTPSGWKMVNIGRQEDLKAAAFAISQYLRDGEDIYGRGQLRTLERRVNTFLMDNQEETWSRMCLQLYNCLLSGACVYLNRYEEDMNSRGGMRLMFTSQEAANWLDTSSSNVLPLELLLRDIVEDDSDSRGLAIMSDNGWQFTAVLPKEAVADLYHLYLSEVAGS